MQVKVFKIKLKKGDLVQVIRGKLKGQTGRVLSLHPKTNQVTVDGVNLVTKHFKPNKQYPQGAIDTILKPLNISQVAIVEPQSQKPSRIGWQIKTDGSKERIYQKTKKKVVIQQVKK
ncbi:MAG: 50S ribosomal protein L24 [Candidatus Saccharibacteria bacterium]|nr:50S ribosomal protein L24 [Candidatus Saccharibacteria bacterium]MCY4010958.1 50S ribosomal protein L24 [Candidatus Saccharibacteria bacterium]